MTNFDTIKLCLRNLILNKWKERVSSLSVYIQKNNSILKAHWVSVSSVVCKNIYGSFHSDYYLTYQQYNEIILFCKFCENLKSLPTDPEFILPCVRLFVRMMIILLSVHDLLFSICIYVYMFKL